MPHQDGYLLSHDSDLRTALWVAYRLDGTEVEAGAGKERVNCFRKDPRMTRAKTATTTDYKEPRFDQGHMANDREFKDVLQEQLNTFIMSNMSPQEDCFNRGIWLSLEYQVRRWARTYGKVYVTSGAIFDRNGDGIRDADDEAQRMKSNNDKSRVAVPTRYYKVVWHRDGGRITSAMKAEVLLNESVGAGYIDRQRPPAFADSGAWRLRSLRQSCLDGSLTRLSDPEKVLRRQIAALVAAGEFGLASGARPDEGERAAASAASRHLVRSAESGSVGGTSTTNARFQVEYREEPVESPPTTSRARHTILLVPQPQR